MTMTTETVLKALRANVEHTDEIDGAVWGTVYLDNARADCRPVLKSMNTTERVLNARAFAGSLSALKQRGDYRPLRDGEFDEVFGRVKMT